MKQKIILTLLLLFAAISASAYDLEVDGIYYNINGNEASVTYKTTSYNSYSGDVTIPSSVVYDGTTYPVTSIGEKAFKDCGSLTNVIIPGSVTSIGGAAFDFCRGLTSVTIPNSVTTIGRDAFEFCTGMTSVTIPNSVTSIGRGAFYRCEVLESVIIPGSVTIIDDYMFEGCYGLTSVSIPNSVTAIGDYAFQSCSSLPSVTIPNSVTTIGLRAFMWCSSLPSITIPNSVTSIGMYAFARCHGLKATVVIPSSVTSIGEGLFQGCYNLPNIIVDSDNPVYDSRNDCNAIIETSNNTLIQGCMSTVIPSSVTSIGTGAFSGCTGLPSVTLSNEVTTIGQFAFSLCYSLTSVAIPSSVTTIGGSAFYNCHGLTDVYSYIVDPSAISMGNSVFYEDSVDYSTRTLHVPQGALDAYQADAHWYPYYGQIVEMGSGTGLLGDVNGDGYVDIADINAVMDIILGINGYTAAADVNGDGEITIADVNAIIDLTIKVYDEHEYVDLGLPSGTLWATCNVGAKSPEEYGDYFAWGETEPKESYTWGTYRWCNGTDDTLTKYCSDSEYGTVDNKSFLDGKDDAAYVNWGPEWRMPTIEQMTEFSQYCNKTRTERNGVKGCLITGPNGNTIFLPGSGNWNNGGGAGDYSGYYWSCSGDNSYAMGLDSDSGYSSWGYFNGFRYAGYTIRAVRAPSAEFHIEQKRIDFGAVLLGETETRVLTLVNNTTKNMTLMVIADDPFLVKQGEDYVSSMEIVVPGSTNVPLIVMYNGTEQGQFDGNVTIRKSASDEGQIGIPVHVLAYSDVNMEQDYVDLGLPSGTLWAACNVGASSPEGYGDYFAWGETEPKEVYTWETYKWCNGSEDSLTKYCTNSNYGTVDSKTKLEPEDDAAFVNMGPSWRMPSKEQMAELRSKCTWQWTTLNEEWGHLIIGPNGSTMFLPLPGERVGGDIKYEGSVGDYWSDEIAHYDAPDVAYCTDFGTLSGSARFIGYSVRAVRLSLDDVFIEQKSLDMDGIPIGEKYTSKLTFINNSMEPITMTATVDAPFSFVNDGGNASSMTIVVPSKSYTQATVVFTSTVPGQFNGNVTVQSPALDGGQSIIPVHALAFADDFMHQEYVDLGLPSGTLWATRDVGASSPEEYGDEFIWGQTTPHNNGSRNADNMSDGSEDAMTKCSINSLRSRYENLRESRSELRPESDAAYVNWGPEWRTPSLDQIVELTESCTCSRARINGVIGRLVTGPNGNCMFWPADGYYWSRTSPESDYLANYAYGLFMNSDMDWGIFWGPRGWGHRVRPVRVSQD